MTRAPEVSRSGSTTIGSTRRVALSGMVCAIVLLLLGGSGLAAALWAFSSAAGRWEEIASGDTAYVFDPELGWAAPPGSTSHRRHRSGLTWSFYRDGRGARAAAPTDRVPAVADLVFIGGSFTLGRGVEHEETFAAITADALGVSMSNLGIGGYGTLQSLLMLRRHADLSPRVVVYGFIEDHLRRNLSRCGPNNLPFCTEAPWVDFDDGTHPSIRAPGASALRSWALNRRFYASMTAPEPGLERVRLGARLLGQSGAELFRRRARRAASDPEKRAASIKLLLAMMQGTADEIGARLVVAHIPELLGPDGGTGPAPTVLTSALPSGTELLDLSETLGSDRYRGVSLSMLPDDGHPGPAGHRAIADGLVAYLRETWTREPGAAPAAWPTIEATQS